MEQDALALFYSDGFAVAEALAVDSELLIADFPAVRFFVLLVTGRGLERRFVFVLHLRASQKRFPLMRGKEHFLIKAARVHARFDVDETELSGVGSAAQIGHGH